MIRDDNAREAARDAMIREAKDRALGNWRDLLEAAGLDRAWLSKKGAPCPFCGGRDRYTFTDKYGSGNYFCRGCGPGDGLKLLQFARGLSFMEAIEWVIQWSGGSVPDLSRSPRAPRPVFKPSDDLTPAEIERRKARHKKLWDAAVRVTKGDPVWKHLERRLPGLEEADVPRVLRFHPALEYWEKDEIQDKWVQVGTFPGMVAAIQGPDGVCCNIHRTFLTEDGEKAPVASARKKELSIGVKGAAIRLLPLVGREMSVAEGIETSLAVIRYRGESCWSAVDAGGMEQIVIPDEVDLVRIYQDNDLPDERGQRRGLVAGEKLAQRVKAMGKRAIKYAPGKAGMDMDEFVRSLPKRV